MIHQRRSIVGLLLVVLSCLAAVVAFSQQEDKAAVDTSEYQAAMCSQVADVYDLEQYFVDQQYTFLPILPPDPDFTLVQSGGEVLPFDWKVFPVEFENLVAEYENSVPVYPVRIIEDPISRYVVFFNADGKEVYSIPPAKDYNPFAYVESLYPSLFLNSSDSKEAETLRSLADPAHIQIQTKLIPQEYIEPYLYVQDRLAEEAAKLAASSGGGMMLMRSGYSDADINFEVIARTNSGVRMAIGYPDAFASNRLDVFTCNDVMQYVWVFAARGLSTAGTNEITWVDTNYWVNLGPSVRFYNAGNADRDTDNDGYSDASEIWVYRTSEADSNSRPIRISGTVSYSGIETGLIRVLSTTVSDSWSIAQSVALPGPGVYSNDIGNNQSYYFKGFRDVNSSYVRDEWEPWGVYSSSSTLITGDTSGLNITMQDQPSLWGTIDYTGTETGDVWIVAVTSSNSWDTTYRCVIPWVQGDSSITGGSIYLTFPVSYSIVGVPASNYWIRAFMDSDTNQAYSLLEVAGQYAANAILISNRVTGINITMAFDGDSDGMPDGWELASGLSPGNPADAAEDPDADGLSNLQEYLFDTGPHSRDTDQDGLPDGEEVAAGLSPLFSPLPHRLTALVFSYDDQDRLGSVTSAVSSISMTYDDAGNISTLSCSKGE